MEARIKSHKDLHIWKKSISLVKEIYSITREFPADERFGIIQQMRRSAVSVPSNIAEGAGRASKKEFVYYLSIAQGSLSELETQVIISRELGFVEDVEDIEGLIGGVRAMIWGLMRKLGES